MRRYTEQPYLHEKVHDVSWHLLNQDLDDSQDLSFRPRERGGVDILLRLRVGGEGRVSVHLPESRVWGETQVNTQLPKRSPSLLSYRCCESLCCAERSALRPFLRGCSSLSRYSAAAPLIVTPM